MITFIILMTILLILITGGIIAFSIFGAGCFIVFGDLIVCAILIIWIIKKIIARKKQ